MSGGRATVKRKKKLGRGVDTSLAHVAGDLCAVHKDGEKFIADWFIECKHYRKLKLEAFFFKGGGTLHEFWDTAKTAARRCGKKPMLIFKQNDLPGILVLLLAHDAAMLGLDVYSARAYRPQDQTQVHELEKLLANAELNTYR